MDLPFVALRRERWQKLHQLLERAERDKLSSFSKGELLLLGVLYRQTATDLALAKVQNLPIDLVTFLNNLVSRAYHQIYRSEQTTPRQLVRFFTWEFPALFRQEWRVILLAMLLLLTGWILGFGGYLIGPKIITALLPGKFVSEILKRYESNTWFNDPLMARPFISSWIMVNNIKVALTAFGGGMLLGTLTCWIIAFNGFMLGVLAAVFWKHGYFLSFWAMILPHGVIELTAIGLSAAAGLLLTRAILWPGEYRRQDALYLRGGQAVKLMAGTVFLLVIAGLIEGFCSTISTKIIPETFRLIFACLTVVFLIWYFRRNQESSKKGQNASDKDNVLLRHG